MAQRPRASILSLFDPLSLSPSSDKENDVGDTSFFHPPGISKPSPAVQRTLRRRLIDVGDMTVDEPDMRHLLEMEDELEELNKHIAEDDDGDTLTWRDMAKAATPKWSGRHATAFTTPKSSPTPRTPLSEISFKDEATPMARKKSYKRQIASGPSKLALIDVTPERSVPAPSPPLNTSSDEPSINVPPPSIQVSSVDTDVHDYHSTAPPNAFGSSLYTLNQQATNDNLLADSSLPLSTSQSSSQLLSQSSLSPSTLLTPPVPQARLRPDSHSRAPVGNRMSIDLQSSFQLHLNSSDASFDLLNEKISFFSLKNENDSFLNTPEIDDSFGDDDFALVKSAKQDEERPENFDVSTEPNPTLAEDPTDAYAKNSAESPRPDSLRVFVPEVKSTIQLEGVDSPSRAIVGPLFDDIHEPDHALLDVVVQGPLSVRPPSPTRSPIDEKEFNVLSTPSPSYSCQHPPAPVQGLKIVKRSKILTRRASTIVNDISTTASSSDPISKTSSSRRTSSISSIKPLPARVKTNPPDSSSLARNGSAAQHIVPNPKKTAAPSFANPVILSGDGPRRILVSEGPKLNPLSNARINGHSEPTKALLAVNGPRRIVVNSAVNVVEKPVVAAKPVAASQASSGLKQPIKYSTIGTSSSIPKPVSRNVGSRLPAPATGASKSRFGVPSASVKGLHTRRVT